MIKPQNIILKMIKIIWKKKFIFSFSDVNTPVKLSTIESVEEFSTPKNEPSPEQHRAKTPEGRSRTPQDRYDSQSHHFNNGL